MNTGTAIGLPAVLVNFPDRFGQSPGLLRSTSRWRLRALSLEKGTITTPGDIERLAPGTKRGSAAIVSLCPLLKLFLCPLLKLLLDELVSHGGGS